MLGVLIPKVECTIRARRAEGAVDGVNRYGVDGIDVCDVILWRVPVTFEREVETMEVIAEDVNVDMTANLASLSSTY
jgi:hypothetical protein